MKKGWLQSSLKEACSVFTDGNWIETKDQSTDGIRLVQTGNIGFGFYKDKSDKARYISEETFIKLKCTEILPSDLLVSRLPDPVGKSCLIPDLNTKMITGVDCTIIRTKNYLLPSFLLNYQMSNQYLSDVNSKVSGTTRSRISRKNLGMIKIPIPPIEEQKKIVTILDQAFAAIDQAQANIQQNIQNAQDLFQSKLNQMFSQQGEGWEEFKLLDVCNLKSGKTIAKNLEFPVGEVAYLKVADMNIKGNEFEITCSSRYTNVENIKVNSILPIGTIVFPKRGGAIATNKKRITRIPVCVDLNTMGAISNDKIEPEYLHFYFLSFDLLDISNGTTILQINNYSFDDLKISLPESKKSQKEIIEILEELRVGMLKAENYYQKKSESLEELKKSLLQKAFNGELTQTQRAA